MEIKQVMVGGCGVLGSQIAFQSAIYGFGVRVYDVDEAALDAGRARMERLIPRYQKDRGASVEELREALGRVAFTTNLAHAVAEVDLVIEATPEVLTIKQSFYRQLAGVAPDKTVFATNSSTLIPSQLAASTGRPRRFLALHFANEIWTNNTAEVMRHSGTDDAVFDAVVQFAKAIGMVALPLQKEQPGYILNSLLVPFLDAAQKLWFRGVADIETIDKTWMIATGSPAGPFAILDVVGLNTVYNIASARAETTQNEEYRHLVERLKEEYIDKGKLGRATGEGFYRYPNPG